MGQKVNPIGFRTGFFRDWQSRWFVDRSKFADTVYEDYRIREILKKQAKGAGLSAIEIERRGDEITVEVSAARQGILIGKKGQEIDRIKDMVQAVASGPVKIVIKETHNPDGVAQIISESIVEQLEKRMAFRRVIRKSIETAMATKIKGIKVQVSGRLNGAEMARREKVAVGQMPLHTMRANIDYGFSEAHTTYGIIGVKVWTYDDRPINKNSAKKAAVSSTS